MARQISKISGTIVIAAVLLFTLQGCSNSQTHKTSGMENKQEGIKVDNTKTYTAHPKGRVRVAAGQFTLRQNLDANLEKMMELLDKAADNNVDLIVFPELGLTGYPFEKVVPDIKTFVAYVNQENTEKALNKLQQRAKQLHIAVAVGAAWKGEEDVWQNRAFFIDEDGRILCHYDKIHQTGHERKFFADGKRLPAFSWRGCRLGMLICMDMRYPELWRLLRKDQVSLVLHLASAYGSDQWKVPVLEGTLRARAAENGYHVVSCNNAGPVPMVVSAIYNPKGLILAQANYAVEELIFADIDPNQLQGFVNFADDVYQLKKVSPQ